MEDLYEKNVESVLKICNILGYRLVSYNPDWTIASIEEKMPDNFQRLVANQMLGKYDKIPNEFMGRLALIMGIEWEFQISDERLKISIKESKELVEKAEKNEELRLGLITGDKKLKSRLSSLKTESGNYVNEIKTECDQKVYYFESLLNLRERLRKFNKFHKNLIKPDKKVSVKEFQTEMNRRIGDKSKIE